MAQEKFVLKVNHEDGMYVFKIIVKETGAFFMGERAETMERLEFYKNEVAELNNPSYVRMGNPYAKASMMD